MRFTRVDLPEPEGPMIASHSPGATESETSSSARTSRLLLYTRLTFFSSIGIILLAGSPPAGSAAEFAAAQLTPPAPAMRFPTKPARAATAAAGLRHQS